MLKVPSFEGSGHDAKVICSIHLAFASVARTSPQSVGNVSLVKELNLSYHNKAIK